MKKMIRILLITSAFWIIIPLLAISAEIEIDGTDSIWKSGFKDLIAISKSITPLV
jgi:hypothetical protein